MGIVLALLASGRSRTWPLIGALALMWAGLLFSYSQSSMPHCSRVTLALAYVTGDRRLRRATAVLAVGGPSRHGASPR